MISPAQDEPGWLSGSTPLAIHAQQIERYGGAHGVLDQNAIRSILMRPIRQRAYDETADLADFAAAYLVGFARSQGFSDGNKRTGLASALVFLALNGLRLHVDPRELYALAMRVATNQADDAVVAAYFRERVEPA
jgi:death on curing protein